MGMSTPQMSISGSLSSPLPNTSQHICMMLYSRGPQHVRVPHLKAYPWVAQRGCIDRKFLCGEDVSCLPPAGNALGSWWGATTRAGAPAPPPQSISAGFQSSCKSGAASEVQLSRESDCFKGWWGEEKNALRVTRYFKNLRLVTLSQCDGLIKNTARVGKLCPEHPGLVSVNSQTYWTRRIVAGLFQNKVI